MRLELTGRHLEITPVLRRLIATKLAKLERILNDSAVSAQVVLAREKRRHRVEMTLHARGEKFLHGVSDGESWGAAVAGVADKLAQQALKVKGKRDGRKRRGLDVSGPSVESPAATPPARALRPRVRMPTILRASRQVVTTRSVADAVRQIDASPDGLLVFRDAETLLISVLYRRPGGDLAVVETNL